MMYTAQNSKYNILSLTAREVIKNEKHADCEWHECQPNPENTRVYEAVCSRLRENVPERE